MVREVVAFAFGNSGAVRSSSKRMQGTPRRPSSMASTRPAGPPPTIRTSGFAGIRAVPVRGLGADAGAGSGGGGRLGPVCLLVFATPFARDVVELVDHVGQLPAARGKLVGDLGRNGRLVVADDDLGLLQHPQALGQHLG